MYDTVMAYFIKVCVVILYFLHVSTKQFASLMYQLPQALARYALVLILCHMYTTFLYLLPLQVESLALFSYSVRGQA